MQRFCPIVPAMLDDATSDETRAIPMTLPNCLPTTDMRSRFRLAHRPATVLSGDYLLPISDFRNFIAGLLHDVTNATH
jgi:hypothetical protein